MKPRDIDKPSFEKTYYRADGEMIADEYGWMSDLDCLDDDWEPVELIEETWQRVAVRKVWHVPSHLPPMCLADDLNCEEDAVGWQLEDGAEKPISVCAKHLTNPLSPTVP